MRLGTLSYTESVVVDLDNKQMVAAAYQMVYEKLLDIFSSGNPSLTSKPDASGNLTPWDIPEYLTEFYMTDFYWDAPENQAEEWKKRNCV